MKIWGIDFWTLFFMCLLTAVILIFWGLHAMKRLKKEKLNSFTIFPAIDIAFSLSSTIFAGAALIALYFDPSQGDINGIFKLWAVFLGFAFFSLIIAQIILKTKEGEDKPDKGNVSLKELERKQLEEVKKLTTK